MMDRLWNFYIDRGGTFTDVVAEAPDGSISTLKLLSDNPSYDDAALEGIRRVLGTERNQPISPGPIGEVRMGTTVATNALLERKGEPTLLITTRGFADQLRIGNQNRPKLFSLKIELPLPLYADVVEADERVAADGAVLRRLDRVRLRHDLERAYHSGLRACAILFMHGYRFPDHECCAAEIAREIGFRQISASHETVPLPKFVSRGDTTVADAYLSPLLDTYTSRVEKSLGAATRLLFMTSNGGLSTPGLFRGKDAVLSGPAGGVVGMAETARDAGFERVIGFDMGGTSTDVARFDGGYDRTYETEIGGVRLRTPIMAIHTVAAGGGSILHFDGARFRVGPDSAGARPGPMAYRNGGPLTVTDANVMLGKVRSGYFPSIFGPSGDLPLDRHSVEAAFRSLAEEIGDGRTAEQVADGFIRIAVENMAAAIRKISVARGYDARDFVLNCFGGAGGQHACLVADALGMTRVFIHPLSSLLSAFGMKLALLRRVRQRSVGMPFDIDAIRELDRLSRVLAMESEQEIMAQGATAVRSRVLVHLRCDGSDTTIGIPLSDPDHMSREFHLLHTRQFGFGSEGRPLVIESLEVESESSAASAPRGSHIDIRLRPDTGTSAASSTNPGSVTRFFSRDEWHDAPIYSAASISIGSVLEGPALLIEPHQTIVIERDWRAQVTDGRAVILSRTKEREALLVANTDVDPILLEVFANLFMAIAEEMGVTLQNTAASVNIKERLDFSCAVFDGTGALVANAPHMPVHLGSMGDCVTAMMRKHPDMRDGDVFVTNAPYDGGTHLPDITVVMPVFVDGERRFFVASRGHHADIGGMTPGSMPPFSRTIEQEGVVLDGMQMVRDGVFDEDGLRRVLENAPFPTRNSAQNIADLKAQTAACAKGAAELHRACTQHGYGVIEAYMRHVQDNAEESVRRVIGSLKDGEFEMPMDGGHVIRVSVRVDPVARSATIDFTGTSPQASNNFNAPRSVTKAAVLYVFRCLVDSDIPMNAGCLKPLEIVVPDGSLLNPRWPGAVAAGNVETSQAVVDALFGCLGVLAASQGTMNNLTFGDSRHQYYETICGGAGAGRDFDGQSAVHTHMTNSRLTDPEILENRFPVIVEEFAIRRGSGGAGARCGGDGATRRVRFRQPMTAAILSTRRETDPFGLEGGNPGARGVTTLILANGDRRILAGCDEVAVEAGDAIEIETPGGGGFGAAKGCFR